MQKWEYCTIQTEIGTPDSGTTKHRRTLFIMDPSSPGFKRDYISDWLDPQKIQKDKDSRIFLDPFRAWEYAVIARLGADGWELIQIDAPSSSFRSYFFKRPIED
jgi:hypothetical protein